MDQEENREDTNNKLSNEQGDIIIDPANIRKLVRGYFEQYKGNNLENLSWMDLFLEIEMDLLLEKNNLPKLKKRKCRPKKVENLVL